jgi:hypothetical protein
MRLGVAEIAIQPIIVSRILYFYKLIICASFQRFITGFFKEIKSAFMNNGFGLVFLNFAHEAFFIIVRSLDSGSLETVLYKVDLYLFRMSEVRKIIHLQGNCAFANQTFPGAIVFSMIKRILFTSEIMGSLS